jgi:hypothetical protein
MPAPKKPAAAKKSAATDRSLAVRLPKLPVRPMSPLVATLATAQLTLGVATHALAVDQPAAGQAAAMSAVKHQHGNDGPWAMVGFRLGQAALAARPEGKMHFTHYGPSAPQYTCIMDGIKAAAEEAHRSVEVTFVEAGRDALRTDVVDAKGAKVATYRLRDDVKARILDVAPSAYAARSAEVYHAPDTALFWVE